jgi:DNA-binding NarL/FixJ family response regulator
VKLKEIAKEEYLSLSEINRVTRDLKDRLGARNLAQAVLLACQNGLITPVDEKGISQPQSMLPKID